VCSHTIASMPCSQANNNRTRTRQPRLESRHTHDATEPGCVHPGHRPRTCKSLPCSSRDGVTLKWPVHGVACNAVPCLPPIGCLYSMYSERRNSTTRHGTQMMLHDRGAPHSTLHDYFKSRTSRPIVHNAVFWAEETFDAVPYP
jgi:hypothetical protein